MIRDYSYNVYWEDPIGLLMIDALHDFFNVAVDFSQFEDQLVDGGIVAFHDYWPPWPDVISFVNQLTASGAYEVLTIAESLAVLRKRRTLIGMPVQDVLDKMDAVHGWYSPAEGCQLALSAATALSGPDPGTIVEVGSHCGRTTVVLGEVARRHGGHVWAIDRFDGVVGARPDLLEKGPPTRGTFDRTMKENDLLGTVDVIEGAVPDVEWDQPISLLHVDGLRDYQAVIDDFTHFDPWVQDGGLVAFHDFDGSWPSVQLAVWDILDRDEYTRYATTQSLTVLQKSTGS